MTSAFRDQRKENDLPKTKLIALSFDESAWTSRDVGSLCRAVANELKTHGIGSGWYFIFDDLVPEERVRGALEKHVSPERAETITIEMG